MMQTKSSIHFSLSDSFLGMHFSWAWRFPQMCLYYSQTVVLRLRLGTNQSVGVVCNTQMIDDTDLGFFANFLGVSIFLLLVAYHYVVAEPKYDAHY